MKELQSLPEEEEIKSIFLQTTQRRIGEGDLKQDKLWIDYFSTITGLRPQEFLENRQLLLLETVTKSKRTSNIDETLRLEELRLGNPKQDIETEMLIAGASFHIRYSESEYRLSIDRQLAENIFSDTNKRSVNFDVYGVTGSARVRFSPEFKQVRFNVKVPICEYPDGRRTRLKFEYRGTPPGNRQFEDDAKLVALDFLSKNVSSFLIKQSVEIIKRDQVNLPVWINRELVLEDKYGEMLGGDSSLSKQERLALLNKILNNPEDFTHAGSEYWLEIDANSETEMQNNILDYLSRSDTSEKKGVFSSARPMK